LLGARGHATASSGWGEMLGLACSPMSACVRSGVSRMKAPHRTGICGLDLESTVAKFSGGMSHRSPPGTGRPDRLDGSFQPTSAVQHLAGRGELRWRTCSVCLAWSLLWVARAVHNHYAPLQIRQAVRRAVIPRHHRSCVGRLRLVAVHLGQKEWSCPRKPTCAGSAVSNPKRAIRVQLRPLSTPRRCNSGHRRRVPQHLRKRLTCGRLVQALNLERGYQN